MQVWQESYLKGDKGGTIRTRRHRATPCDSQERKVPGAYPIASVLAPRTSCGSSLGLDAWLLPPKEGFARGSLALCPGLDITGSSSAG